MLLASVAIVVVWIATLVLSFALLFTALGG